MPLAAALSRVIASDVIAPVDAPPFDRANVDGFAVRAADTAGASPARRSGFALNAEVIACGVTPGIEVAPGTATTIATGGVIPRGADAVVMIEHTELIEDDAAPAIDVHRAAASGQFISYAGSDIARGETLLRRGTEIGSREIGMLAACGFAASKSSAVLASRSFRPATSWLNPAGRFVPAASMTAMAPSSPLPSPKPAAKRWRSAPCRTTKRRSNARCASARFVRHGRAQRRYIERRRRSIAPRRVAARQPGILVHGVALKPGKPLCLAVIGDKPLVVLPGFPTSAIFTFHAFVAPIIRARAGLPAEAARTVTARVPVRVPSELGREEFVLVSLVAAEDGLIAFPTGKGSGAVTAFSQADGFLAIDALASALDAETEAEVTLIGQAEHAPDLVIMGSHDVALDVVVGALAERGLRARTIAVGSLGGVNAASRGECDIAPVHLVDPATGIYNKHLLEPGLALVPAGGACRALCFVRAMRALRVSAPRPRCKRRSPTRLS